MILFVCFSFLPCSETSLALQALYRGPEVLQRFGFAACTYQAHCIVTAEALARMALSIPLSRTAYDTQELGQEETAHAHACV